MMKEYGPPHTTQQERFEGFALAHLGLSGLCFLLFLPSLGLADMVFGWAGVAVVVYMLAYFPLGMATARLNRWTAPLTDRERWQAVAYPTAVAWAWVGFVLLSLAMENGSLIIMVFYVSVMLAAPSSALVLVLMPLWGNMDPLNALDTLDSLGALALTGLVAGLLPPLLFTWGSFWASALMGRKQTAHPAPV